MNEPTITIAGNLVEDPELRFTPTGQPVVRFRITSTPSYLDKSSGEWRNGETVFLTCQIWRQTAENVAESLTRGARVFVTGRLRQSAYETKEGEKRTAYKIEVDEVGASLRSATVRIKKVVRSAAQEQYQAAEDAPI